jgi:hypothetical protein
MAWNVEAVTPWVVQDDGTKELAIVLDYPTPFGWCDLTEQPVENIPSAPNVVVVVGRGLTYAQLTALEADAAYVVLTAEAV